MPKLTDYKTFEVYVADDGLFTAYKDHERVCSAKSFEDLRKELDKLSKAKFGQSVYVAQGYGNYSKGRITSMREAVHRVEFHVQYDEKERTWELVSISELIKPTEKSIKAIEEIEESGRQIHDLKKKIDKFSEELEYYTKEELLGSE